MPVRYDFGRIYALLLGPHPSQRVGSDGWFQTLCPFHEEKNPSFSYNLEHGGFKCHGCNTSGTVTDFVGMIKIPNWVAHDDQKKEARDLIREILGHKRPGPRKGTPSTKRPKGEAKRNRSTPLPNNDEVRHWAQALFQVDHADRLNLLVDKRRWSEDTIHDLGIGWDRSMGRYTLPVTMGGQLFNVRRYLPGAAIAKMKGVQGHNTAALYPESCLEKSTIYLCEGEPDMIAARSLGMNAATLCCGAETVPEAQLERLQGKRVVILYDADKPGRSGASKVAICLAQWTGFVKIVDLGGLLCDDGKDLTDFLLQGGQPVELKRAIDMQPWPDAAPIKRDEVFEPGLEAAIEARYRGSTLRVRASVIGKTYSPYIVPVRVKMECSSAGTKPECGVCRIMNNKGEHWELDTMDAGVLRLIRSPDGAVLKALDALIGAGCPRWRGEGESVIEEESLHELILGEDLDLIGDPDTLINAGLVQRAAYVLGGDWALNQAYYFEGTTVADPNSQEARHLFSKGAPVRHDIDCFDLTDEIRADLALFRVVDGLAGSVENASDNGGARAPASPEPQEAPLEGSDGDPAIAALADL